MLPDLTQLTDNERRVLFVLEGEQPSHVAHCGGLTAREIGLLAEIDSVDAVVAVTALEAYGLVVGARHFGVALFAAIETHNADSNEYEMTPDAQQIVVLMNLHRIQVQ